MASTPASRSRLGLSSTRIVEAADAILAETGLDGLTMRAVAERLGVGTMTLYGYFRDKDQLLDALIDAKSDALEIPQSDGPWRPRLRELMLHLHAQLVENPFLAALRLRRPLMSAGAMRWTETGLKLLADAGLPRAEAARAFRGLFVFTFGHAVFLPAGDAEEVVRAARAALLALPSESFPAVTAAADELPKTLVEQETYEYCLDRMLDGIEAELSRLAGGR